MSAPKTVRVEIEKDDGTIIRLTGEEARKWGDHVEGMATCCHVHRRSFPELKWEQAKKDAASK